MDYSQFVGKPFEVISKVGLRYTGIFDHISQENQTICLADVYNQGSENRLERFVPGSAKSLGWVRFHTESIQSLALIEKNGPPPGLEEPVDPSLASVSSSAPPTSSSYVAPAPAPSPAQAVQPTPARHELPSKPPAQESGASDSASTAMNRVRESMSGAPSDPRQRNDNRRRAQPIEVPDTEFDFSKGTETFERERAQRKTSTAGVDKAEEGEDLGEPENAPHPSVLAGLATSPANDKPASGAPAYNKNDFFDGLSGASSRVSRNEERHRNFDTFGEAGGSTGGRGGGRGGSGARGGRGGGPGAGAGGGYGGGGYRGGYGGQRRGGRGGSGYNATPEWA